MEWTDTLRWAELPAALRDQLAVELMAMLGRAVLRRIGSGTRSERNE